MPVTRTRTAGPSIPLITSRVPSEACSAWANDASRTIPLGAGGQPAALAHQQAADTRHDRRHRAHLDRRAGLHPARWSRPRLVRPGHGGHPARNAPVRRVSVRGARRIQISAPLDCVNSPRHGLAAPSRMVTDSSSAASTPATTSISTTRGHGVPAGQRESSAARPACGSPAESQHPGCPDGLPRSAPGSRPHR